MPVEVPCLIGANGDEFGLRVVGYQFPGSAAAEYDSNWLTVEVVARVGGRSWTVRDPCLLTWELAWLHEWIMGVAVGRPSHVEVSFLEPNLRLELRDGLGGSTVFRVYFELELRPPWAPADGAGMDDLYATIECSAQALHDFAEALGLQRKEYPSRAGVGTSRDRPYFLRGGR